MYLLSCGDTPARAKVREFQEPCYMFQNTFERSMWSAIIKALEAPIDEAMRKRKPQRIASRGASPATQTSAAALKKKVLKHRELTFIKPRTPSALALQHFSVQIKRLRWKMCGK